MLETNITIRQLEVFAAIANKGNVTKASEQLFISQSAASMALAEFERQIGQKLFDRFGRKLVLNEAGRALLPKVIELLTRVDEIPAMFSPEGRLSFGSLEIGASSTIANYYIPSLLGEFTENFPEIQLRLEVGNTEQIINSLTEFKIDVGYIEGLCNHPQINCSLWREDQLVVFASPEHRLASKRRITLKDLSLERWILREKGSGTRVIFENAVAGKLDDLNIRFELGHTEAIKSAVKSNLGISCLSRLTVAESIRNGSLVELKTPFLNLRRNFYRLVHKEKYITNVLEKFMDFCS